MMFLVTTTVRLSVCEASPTLRQRTIREIRSPRLLMVDLPALSGSGLARIRGGSSCPTRGFARLPVFLRRRGDQHNAGHDDKGVIYLRGPLDSNIS